MLYFHHPNHLATQKHRQINENYVDAETEHYNEDNESNSNYWRTEATTSLLTESTSGVASNGKTSSCHDNDASDVENRDKSPTRKRKIASDAWKTIKRIKNQDFLASDKERMTCACAQYGVVKNVLKTRERLCG